MNIGDALKNIRKKAKITQLKMSKDIGISQTYLSQIENGERIPSIGVLEQISSFHGIPLGVMMWYSVESADVKKEKQDIYNKLKPTIDKIIEDIFLD